MHLQNFFSKTASRAVINVKFEQKSASRAEVKHKNGLKTILFQKILGRTHFKHVFRNYATLYLSKIHCTRKPLPSVIGPIKWKISEINMLVVCMSSDVSESLHCFLQLVGRSDVKSRMVWQHFGRNLKLKNDQIWSEMV